MAHSAISFGILKIEIKHAAKKVPQPDCGIRPEKDAIGNHLFLIMTST